ncbi:MAG: signal peptidase I [Ruminococcus sp.]
MERIRKILSALSFVFLGIMVVFVIFLFVQRVSGTNTGIFGYSVYRVSSASMEPELSVGDVILSKKIMPETLEIGDIISYNGREGDYQGKIITHKIVDIKETGYGRVFTTKGIANANNDPAVEEFQVLGKMQFKIPIVGTLYNFFMTPYGLVAVILLILLAFSNEIITLYRLAKRKVQENVVKEFEEAVKNEGDKDDGDKTE